MGGRVKRRGGKEGWVKRRGWGSCFGDRGPLRRTWSKWMGGIGRRRQEGGCCTAPC